MIDLALRSGERCAKSGVLVCVLMLAGCGSAYKGVVDTSGLGAAQYIPAVYVEVGQEEKYAQVLNICRQSALNREMTAAQEAQLATLTGAAGGAVEGAGRALQMGNIFEMVGIDVDMGDQALMGAGLGVLGGLTQAMTRGAEETAAETKEVLLRCLRLTSRDGQLWQVLE